MRFRTLFGVLVLLIAHYLYAQNADKPIFVANASSKFVNVRGVPACLTVAPQQGDAAKEASVVQLKLASGALYRGTGTRLTRSSFLFRGGRSGK